MHDKISNLKKIILNEKNSYLIAKDDNLDISDFIDSIANFLKSGYKIIHYIPENLNDKKTLEISKKIRQLASIYNSLFFISSRADIVKVADADGIMLKSENISLCDVQKVLHDDKFFGYILDNVQDVVFDVENGFDIVLIPFEIKQPVKDYLTSLQSGISFFYVDKNINENFYGVKKI